MIKVLRSKDSSAQAVPGVRQKIMASTARPFGSRMSIGIWTKCDAMSRVRRRLLASEAGTAALERAGEALSKRPLSRLFVRDRDAIRPLPLTAVERLEARDDYVAVHAQGRTYLLSVPLLKLEERLDPERFVRVHRSHIVNLDFITASHAHDAWRMIVELADGTKVVASKSGSQRLRQLAQG